MYLYVCMYVSISVCHVFFVCGWGAAPPGGLVDYVLSEFNRNEKKDLDNVLYDSMDAIETWIANDDLDKVINIVNAPRAKGGGL